MLSWSIDTSVEEERNGNTVVEWCGSEGEWRRLSSTMVVWVYGCGGFDGTWKKKQGCMRCCVVYTARHVNTNTRFPSDSSLFSTKKYFFSFTWTERVLEGSGWLFEFSFTLHTGISASVEHMDIMVLDYRYIVYRRPHWLGKRTGWSLYWHVKMFSGCC